jgi:lipopolysaccharide export LptBFGC system permease protein LptF
MWIALFALEILLTLSFVPPHRLRAVISAELTESKRMLGDENADRAVRAANDAYGNLLAATPLVGAREEPESPIRPARRGIDVILARGEALLYLALFRINTLRGLAIPTMALVFAAAVDGLAMRRRRAFSFATTSTAVYNAASYLVLSFSVLPLLYLMAPVPVSPAALPIAGIAAAGAVWVFLAHLPGAAPISRWRT